MPSLAGMFSALLPAELFELDQAIREYHYVATMLLIHPADADKILLAEFEKSKRSTTSMLTAVMIAKHRIKEPQK